MRKFITLIVATALLAGCSSSPEVGIDSAIDTSSISTFDGEGEITIEELRDGKPAFVTAWASWCTICMGEMPDIIAFSEEHPEIAVIGINTQDSFIKAEEAVEKLGLEFPLAADRDGDILQEVGMFAVPTSFLINTDGEVVYDVVGKIDRSTIEQVVDERL